MSKPNPDALINFQSRSGQADLARLAAATPGLSPAFAGSLAEAAAVCLESCGHRPGVKIFLEGDCQGTYELLWEPAADTARQWLADPPLTTEWGAVAITLSILVELTGFTRLERARTGSGFDYWIGSGSGDLFERMTRLEISGIMHGSDTQVRQRMSYKVAQLDGARNPNFSSIVAIVEFGRPELRLGSP
jgi:hypothetical protein